MSVNFLNEQSVVNTEYLEQLVIAATSLARDKGFDAQAPLTVEQAVQLGTFGAPSMLRSAESTAPDAQFGVKPDDYDF